MDDGARRFWKNLERYGFERSYWDAKCRAFFEEFKIEHAARRGKRRWAEKTPTYAEHLPFVSALFPEAQIIHIIRDARLVTASAFARWGWRRAWQAPETWVSCITEARAFGAGASPERYYEIRFEALVSDAEATLRPLFEWLGEDWDPVVLSYDRVEHEDGPDGWKKTSARSRASSGHAVDPQRARKPRRPIDPALRARIEYVAGRLNRQLGYR